MRRTKFYPLKVSPRNMAFVCFFVLLSNKNKVVSRMVQSQKNKNKKLFLPVTLSALSTLLVPHADYNK